MLTSFYPQWYMWEAAQRFLIECSSFRLNCFHFRNCSLPKDDIDISVDLAWWRWVTILRHWALPSNMNIMWQTAYSMIDYDSQKLHFSDRMGMHSFLNKLLWGQVSKGSGGKLKNTKIPQHLKTPEYWNWPEYLIMQCLWFPRWFWLRGGVAGGGNESESGRFLDRGFESKDECCWGDESKSGRHGNWK